MSISQEGNSRPNHIHSNWFGEKSTDSSSDRRISKALPYEQLILILGETRRSLWIHARGFLLNLFPRQVKGKIIFYN